MEGRRSALTTSRDVPEGEPMPPKTEGTVYLGTAGKRRGPGRPD